MGKELKRRALRGTSPETKLLREMFDLDTAFSSNQDQEETVEVRGGKGRKSGPSSSLCFHHRLNLRRSGVRENGTEEPKTLRVRR